MNKFKWLCTLGAYCMGHFCSGAGWVEVEGKRLWKRSCWMILPEMEVLPV